MVNPADTSMRNAPGARLIEVDARNKAVAVLEDLEFDIAVTIEETKSGEGGAGIKVWSLEMGAKGEASRSNQQVPRIRFKIPIVYPPYIDVRTQEIRAEQHKSRMAKMEQRARSTRGPHSWMGR
jgi:hypothetical protein